MKHEKFVIGSLALVFLGCSAGAGATLFNLPAISSASPLTVSCPDFAGGVIPPDFSAYGKGLTPKISWSSPPAGTNGVLLVVEDPDAPGPTPFVHWILAMPGAPTQPTSDTVHGINSNGDDAYFPPHPPDSKPHHYHYEVFALSQPIGNGKLDRDAVVAALNNGALAKGELVATYTKR